MVEVALSPPCNPDSPVERSPGAMDYAAVEIATALTLTRRAAETRLEHALALHGPLARVWERFATGHIGFRKVREFVNSLGHLSPELADGVLDRCLDDSPDMTTGQLRARLSRLVMEADPDGTESSFQAGVEDRKVVTYSNPDFTASEYPTCVFPGCRQPAHQRDLDHRIPFSQGGPTHNDNLGPLCRHHQLARHHAPWQLERQPNGDHRWTSPLSHTYLRRRGPPV